MTTRPALDDQIAALEATLVEKLPRGMVAIHMSTGGVLRNCTARVRGTRQVRKFVMPAEVA